MQKQQATYRIFAVLFALLLVIAPISQNWAIGKSLDAVKQEQKDQTSDEKKDSDETSISTAYAFHATITVGIHLDFDIVDYLPSFPEPVTPIKEFVQIPSFETLSGYLQNICAYYIAPHAP